MKRSRQLATVVTACLSALGLGTLAGCPSAGTSSPYTPITGLVIDSQALTAGLGCGTAPGQVYRYAAVVSFAGPGTLTGLPLSGVFDCFANAQFGNLPTVDGGNTSYAISIYAYDQPSYPAALGSCSDLPGDAPCPGEDPTTVATYAGQARWATTCTATQVQGVSSVATCHPLLPEEAGVDDGGDAGDAGEGDASDGGPIEAGDAGDGAALDASDGRAADAGLDATVPSIVVQTQAFVGAEGGALQCSKAYDAVRAAYEAGVTSGVTTPVTCPSPVVLTPTVPGVAYAIRATLLRHDAAVATAICQATATDASTPVVATCGPAGK